MSRSRLGTVTWPLLVMVLVIGWLQVLPTSGSVIPERTGHKPGDRPFFDLRPCLTFLRRQRLSLVSAAGWALDRHLARVGGKPGVEGKQLRVQRAGELWVAVAEKLVAQDRLELEHVGDV